MHIPALNVHSSNTSIEAFKALEQQEAVESVSLPVQSHICRTSVCCTVQLSPQTTINNIPVDMGMYGVELGSDSLIRAWLDDS